MLGKGRGQRQPGKIRLPKQSTFPDLNMLKNLYEQAQVNRGQEVELAWALPGSYRTFSILIKFDQVTPHPQWYVWEDDGRQSKLVSKFETSDMNLILDVVMMLETQLGVNSTGNYAPVNVTGQNPPVSASGTNYPNTQQQQTFGSGQYQPVKTTGGYPQTNLRGSGGYQTYQPSEPEYYGAGGQTAGFQALGSGTAHPTVGQGQQQQKYAGTPAIGGGFTREPQMAMPEGSLPSDFYSDSPAVPGMGPASTATALEGTLGKTKMADLLTNLSVNKLSGMLEVIGENATGQVYYVDGVPKHAQAGATRGDTAIKELVTWRTGAYKFHTKTFTEMRSCERPLQASIMEGTALLNQLKHLQEAGLVYESQLVLKQKNLGETELKLMLSKGHPLDFEWQKQIYEMLKRKHTFTDLLRDKPMEMSQWAPLLFNFLYCGLMDIKEPSVNRGGALDFLGDFKQSVQALRFNFVRPETGLFTPEAVFYFLEYEFYRFEAYNFPLSLILFEMSKKKLDGGLGADLLSSQAINTAALRIELVKRPLDLLGHFDANEYCLILPNTKPSQAAFVANRILEALINTPLSHDTERRNLNLAFGVSGLPSEGEDLAALLETARSAKNEAREGTFPIVLSRTRKRD